MIMSNYPNYGVIGVEGYEGTGKSTFIQDLVNLGSNGICEPYIEYRPSYEDLNIDSFLGRESRCVLGVAALDAYSQLHPNSKILLDRTLPSNLVYSYLYNQVPYSSKRMTSVISAYTTLYEKLGGCLIVYKYHDSKEFAEVMYNASLADSDHADEYDKHDTFEEYWKKYSTFDTEYRKVFEIIKLPVLMSPSNRLLRSELVVYK